MRGSPGIQQTVGRRWLPGRMQVASVSAHCRSAGCAGRPNTRSQRKPQKLRSS
jgi:hypothetical protein